jgi:L-ascorbate metabolism protein UlaG (beta-lactamase superfamily)
MIKNIADNIKWFGHASLMLKIDGKNIFIDPWKLKKVKEKADIILITHSHFDHFSEDDIKKILKPDTFLYSSEDVVNKVSVKNKKIIKPFEEVSLGSIIIKGFPAYNTNKNFHPKSNNWLGFIIEYGGVSIYIAGDSDVTEEAKKIKANIMILPIGGTYTMNDFEAAELVNLVKPEYAIPIHFGDVVGTKENAFKFKSLVNKPTVVLIKEKN